VILAQRLTRDTGVLRSSGQAPAGVAASAAASAA